MTTTVLVGANRGIGLELAKRLAKRGGTLYATCRTPSKELSALGARIVADIDVAAEDVGAKLKEALGDASIDLLVCNAGVLERDSLGTLKIDPIRRQLEINALGPLRVVSALQGSLARGAKVALVTSRMGSMADNGSGGYYGYRMSKAALNAAGVSLARDLKAKDVALVLLHPGFVKTQMTNGAGDIEPSVAAERMLARIDELTLATSGSFKHSNGESLPF